jgi:hypothetical protein
LLGSTDLRAGAQSRSRHLVDLGVRRALSAGSAVRLFAWAERGRSTVLRHPPARPAAEPEVAAALTRWRWAASAESEQRLGGGTASREGQATRAAERLVRTLVRRARAVDGDSRPATASRVRAMIDRGAFVQYVVSESSLWATTTRSSGISLSRLCPAAEVESLVRSIAFALRRSASAGRGTAWDHYGELIRLFERLDSITVDPLGLAPADELITMCAAGPLTSIPWNLVPSLTSRVVTVAPSATSWWSADRRSQVAAVAGPGLPGADRECETIGSIHGDAQVLIGARATTASVGRAALETDLLHLAAHGRLRRDNPLFSTLALVDGPLCGYDIESWPSAPATVVLSACSAGATAPVVGDEVLGLAAIMLGAGARTVIAAPVPVPDELTASVMVRLHEELAGRQPAAAALHACQRSFDDGDPLARLVARSFLAVGA